MGWIASFMMVAAQTNMAAPMAGMDHPPVACPATPIALPNEMAGWAQRLPIKAAVGAKGATALTLGNGGVATLLPIASVTYPVRPGRSGDAVSNGGLFAFVAPAAGRYRVALGSGAWIDVVRDGKPVASISHGHGPDCSGIRKMVDFDLATGRYLLQVAGSRSVSLSLMVTRLP